MKVGYYSLSGCDYERPKGVGPVDFLLFFRFLGIKWDAFYCFFSESSEIR